MDISIPHLIYEEDSFGVFLLVTVFLGGGAAWLTGRAIAATLVRHGMLVTVLGRTRAALDEAVAAGDAHFADVADVADQASITAAIKRAAERQPIDILVANAGAAESAPPTVERRRFRTADKERSLHRPCCQCPPVDRRSNP